MNFKLTFMLLFSLVCGAASSAHGQDFQTDWSFSDSQYNSLQLSKKLKIKMSRFRRSLQFEGAKSNEFYGPTRTYGIFRDVKDEKSFYVLGQVSASNHGMALHHYAAPEYTRKLMVQTHERQRESALSFHQTKDGNIFVISKQGLLLCFRDGKFVDRYSIDGFYQNPTKMFRPIEGFVTEDNRVIFFSRVTSDFQGKALRDLIVYKDGEFEKIDLKGKPLGSVQVTIGDKLNFLTPNGIQVVNTKTGDIKLKSIPEPTDDGKPLFPVGFFATKNGRLISVWRKSKVKGSSYRFETFKDGYYTKVAELKSGKWEFGPIGLDDQPLKWQPRFAEDSAGRVWISGSKNDRLLVRHPDGRYQLTDTMRKLNSFWISKISFDEEDKIVFHSSAFSGTTSFSMTELLAKKAVKFSNWKKVLSRTPLIPDSQKSLYGISSEKGGKLLKITGREFQYFDLPEEKQFNALGSVYLTTDTKGNVWLFADKQGKVAVFEDGNWTVFKSETRDGKEWTGKMVALFDRAKKLDGNLDYQIGLVGAIRVSFGPKDQIAFVNPKNRITYFDGELWHDPKAGFETGRVRASGEPYFEDGEIRFFD